MIARRVRARAVKPHVVQHPLLAMRMQAASPPAITAPGGPTTARHAAIGDDEVEHDEVTMVCAHRLERSLLVARAVKHVLGSPTAVVLRRQTAVWRPTPENPCVPKRHFERVAAVTPHARTIRFPRAIKEATPIFFTAWPVVAPLVLFDDAWS
eukprot:scaffold40989_cov59-Phaeocystis_antarctica.AAC.3